MVGRISLVCLITQTGTSECHKVVMIIQSVSAHDLTPSWKEEESSLGNLICSVQG